MRFDAALSYLVLSTAALASPASAAEYKEADNARPTRKRTLRATAAEAEAEVVSALRAPADAPVAATAVGDKAAVMTPQEEEDVRLLRLDDAYYWKKFLDGDKSMPDGCNFDVEVGCELKFAGGNQFRDCDDAFVCTSDITEQKFQYLGGGCAEEGATNARKYECKIYNDGPDVSETVRVMVVYGDWWDAITSGAAATYQKARDRLNDLTDGRLNTITLVNRDDVSKNDIYELKDLGDPDDAPSDVDTDDLTYIVFEDGSDGDLLMKATWEWKCSGKNSGRYSIFDVFGNSELDGFDSDRYGYVQPGFPRAQMQLTTTLENKCAGAEGMVAHLDRRFCYRDIGDAGYTCDPSPQYGPPLSDPAKLCVDQGQYAANADCVADGPLPGEGTSMVPFVIKPGSDITFTDTYFDMLRIVEGREFQYRIPNATVYFKNDGGEYVQNLNTREEWFFGAGSPPAPTPTPGECNVDVSNIQCEVTTGNNEYRKCEDIWKCTNDMQRQRFLYLGGGCKSEDFDSDVQYSCRTYDGGPGDSTRRVEIYQGDWYGIIEDNDSIQEVRNKIRAQVQSTNSGCNDGSVRLLDQVNVNEGTILSPQDFRTTPCLSPDDTEKLTYVVYQNDGNLGNADVRMKASWKWDCAPTGNEFFPMEAEYSMYDNFGNAELIFFASAQYGFVEEGLHTTRFQYTFENNCEAEGRIVEFDRQLCARECDDSKDDDWSCPTSAKSVCVANDVAANPPCTGSTTLPASSSTTIADNYGLIPIGPNYEFQMRLLDISIEFNNDMTKTSSEEREVFEFCANDSRTGSGGSGTGGGSGGGGSAGGGSGGGGSGGGTGGSNKSGRRRALADSRGKLALNNNKTNKKQARNGGRAARRNDWEDNPFF